MEVKKRSFSSCKQFTLRSKTAIGNRQQRRGEKMFLDSLGFKLNIKTRLLYVNCVGVVSHSLTESRKIPAGTFAPQQFTLPSVFKDHVSSLTCRGRTAEKLREKEAKVHFPFWEIFATNLAWSRNQQKPQLQLHVFKKSEAGLSDVIKVTYLVNDKSIEL